MRTVRRGFWIWLWAGLMVLAGCGPAEDPPVGNPPQSSVKAEAASTQQDLQPGALSVLDVSEREWDGKRGIAVTFSRPLATNKNIQSYFSISDQADGAIAGAWVVDDSGSKAWFMNAEPERTYSVRVHAGLLAQNGEALVADYTAQVTLASLKASVNFASEGSVLPLGYAAGLPVVSVNVDAVEMDFFRVKDDQLAQFVERTQRYGHASWATAYLAELSELVYTARFDLKPEPNRRTTLDIPLQPIDALKPAGVYLAVMRRPGQYSQPQITWFTRTDIGLHVRQYSTGWQVQTHSLTTGEVLANVQVKILNRKNEVLVEATTNAEGAVRVDAPKGAQSLVALREQQLTLLDLQRSTLDLSAFELGTRPQLPQEFFVYGPRDLYRPGEEVTFAGLLRDGDGLLKGASVLRADIRSPNGTKVKSFKWVAQTQGYYQYQWVIPQDAATGTWWLEVHGALKNPVRYRFQVEEFLPERLKVTLGGDQGHLQPTDMTAPLVVPIQSDYLYGAPAAGNRASAFVRMQLWQNPIPALPHYHFGHVLEDQFLAYSELNDIALDDTGTGQWRIESNWQATQSPLKAQVTASVYESGGRAVTRAQSVLLWPAETLIGIRPGFAEGANPKAQSRVRFDLINATATGGLKALAAAEVRLIQEDRQYFWEYNDHEGWHWRWTEKEFPVFEQTVALTDARATAIDVPVTWGHYRLEVKDAASGRVSSLRFFAGHDWYYDWKNAKNQTAARPDVINLALDKPAYQAGESAELKILPPSAGQVLVMVEGDRPLWSQVVNVPKAGALVTLPIDPQWREHNLYVTAMMVEPIGDKTRMTPKRSLGLLHLPLDRSARKLQLALETPDTVRPSQTLTVPVSLGVPHARTHVTLAAVDVGVLNISDFKTPDAFEHFFGKRQYTAHVQDMYAEVIEYRNNRAAKERFGGDADLTRGGKQPNSEVQIVSLFSGLQTFDAEGRAEIDLTLPDFNGRLRLMALAFNDAQYGHAEAELTVASPIVAELAMPRFLAFGDRAMATLDVQNMTEQQETLNLSLGVSGAVALTDSTLSAHTLSLAPKQKITLEFPLEAVGVDGAGTLDLTLSSTHSGSLKRQWRLGVRPAYPAVTHKWQPVLQNGETFTLSAEAVDEVIPTTLQGTLQVSPFVNLNAAEHLRHLLGYPYGCLEQTTSKAEPLTYASGEVQALMGLSRLDEVERLKRIQAGVDRVRQFSRPGGGFGLWGKNSPEEHWLTAYATQFLLNAQNQGADVPEVLLSASLKRLQFYLSSAGALNRARWSEDPKHYAFATRAFAAYVLSQANQASLGTLRTLYQRDFKHAKTGLAQLHLALALRRAGDLKTSQAAMSEALNWRPGEREYLGDYGSAVRDLGQMVHLLLSHQVQVPEALALAVALRDETRGRRWLSTQERTALFLAGLALGAKADAAWAGNWQVGDTPAQAIASEGLWQKGFSPEALGAGVTLASRHTASLFVEATLNGYTRTPPPASDEGIHLARNWYTVKGEPTTPARAKVGDLLVVHLALSVDERVPDALVVNLLPAGLELENQNLDHAIALEDFKVAGEPIATLTASTQRVYEEFRDDRYVAALDLAEGRASHVFFLVRAVTPGVFQLPPALAEDMYRPDIRGVSASEGVLEVIQHARDAKGP